MSADPSGIKSVRLAITRRKGDRCWTFAGGRERFVRHRCGGWKSFKIGDRADWSYLLPERLGTGRYTIRVVAIDKAGNDGATRREDPASDEAVAARAAGRGGARRPGVRRLGRRDGRRQARRAASPRTRWRSKARSATVDGRRCALGRATPLSVLAGAGRAVHRARLRVVLAPRARRGLALRAADRPRRRARARRLGLQGRQPLRQRRRGRPGGSFGTGRTLRAGQRVLWFWCVKDRRDACQRTLATTAHAAAGSVHVIVRGYDEQRPRQAGGGRDGPARRRHRDHRRRRRGDAGRARGPAPAHREQGAGLVPAFPQTVTVG